MTITPTPGIDPTRKLFRVRLDGAPAEPLPGDQEAIRPAHDAIATALAAETVGVAQRAMEMAVEYAKDRKQFGRPIGAYQAVSHRCAQMLLETEGARSATYYAAWALDHEPESGALAASMAKAYASDAGFRVTGLLAAGPRRHRLHLGARPALLPQARQGQRPRLRRRALAPRARRRARRDLSAALARAELAGARATHAHATGRGRRARRRRRTS